MKAGFVAVVGRANAGKSTLVNALVGEKVAIVSPKPQTTRDRILGVYNGEGVQIAYVDTPGIFPMLVAYTKTDIMPEENIPADAARLFEEGIDCDVVPVSARRGKNLRKLVAAITEKLPEGEPLFPEDVLSDKSEKFMIGEIMREKILLRYDKEIPHGVAILVNTFRKREEGNLYDVDLDIICEKANHKAILIGRQGRALKETLADARRGMEAFLGAKVFLTAYVKVKDDWRDKANLLREYGYDDPQG